MKNLLERAAELVRKKSSAEELLSVHREIEARIGEIESELRAARATIDTCDSVAEAEQAQRNCDRLSAEQRIALRRRSEIHEQRKQALAREAIQKAPALCKQLATATEKAMTAVNAAEALAAELARARGAAAEIGEDTERPDADVVHRLAGLLFEAGSPHDRFVTQLGAKPRYRSKSRPLGTVA